MKLKEVIHLIGEIDDMGDEIKNLPAGTVKNGPSATVRLAGRKGRLRTTIEVEE